MDPSSARARNGLARCWNVLRRDRETLDLLAEEPAASHERAVALNRLGRIDEAEAELRRLLDADPWHRHGWKLLASLLRKAGRTDEMVALCEHLHRQGVGHAQLFYDWGLGLALTGRIERARALLLDPARIVPEILPVPEGFADLSAFNTALGEAILASPDRLSDFPEGEEANRGSSRIHALFQARRPELIQALMQACQQAAEAYAPNRYPEFDPWFDARPKAAHLRVWGLIQRGGDYEEWHLHRGGWLSGVYYVCVPDSVSEEGDGPGCIEFGAPTALQRAMPGFIPAWRHRPRAGTLLLAPSHYPHRTIPNPADDQRISIAFDVVPDA